MNQRIIYQTDDGRVAVIIPAPDCGLTIEQIAGKDIPARRVFTVTGTAVITQEDYDADPDYHDRQGYNVGDEYETGTWAEVPRPFKIVDASEIPTDRSARDLWEVDEADLTDVAPPYVAPEQVQRFDLVTLLAWADAGELQPGSPTYDELARAMGLTGEQLGTVLAVTKGMSPEEIAAALRANGVKIGAVE